MPAAPSFYEPHFTKITSAQFILYKFKNLSDYEYNIFYKSQILAFIQARLKKSISIGCQL